MVNLAMFHQDLFSQDSTGTGMNVSVGMYMTISVRFQKDVSHKTFIQVSARNDMAISIRFQQEVVC